MHRRLLPLTCLAIAVFGLAACGSGGDEASEVEDVIVTATTTTDPADCEKLQTRQFMEQISRESGEAAVESCEEDAEDDEGVSDATVSTVEIDGSNATAEAALSGGGLDGQSVEVALVKDGDQWKLDEVVKFTDFDHRHLVEGLEKELSDTDKSEAKFASCFIDAFRGASEAEVEELIFGKSPQALEEVFELCSSSAEA